MYNKHDLSEGFEIYFSDLKEDVQEEFLEFMEIESEKEGNYDIFPLVTINRELNTEEKINMNRKQINEIIIQAKGQNACKEAITWAENVQPENFWKEISPYWAYWLRCCVKDLSESVKRQAEQKTIESSQYACWLRYCVKDLPKDVKRQAEQKAIESSEYAYRLHRDVQDLPESVKRQAEQKAIESSEYAYRLRHCVQDLSEDVKRQAEQKAIESSEYAYWLHCDVQDLPEDVKRQAEQKIEEE